MKIKHYTNLIAWMAVLAGCLNLSAQNTSFTYQGRMQDNGTNFTGTGQFKFALVTSTNTSRQATAMATISGGFVTIYTVVDGGAGYTVAPAVTVSGGGGSGATAVAHISGGVLTSITVNNVGNNYTSPPSVTLAAPPSNLAYTTYWSNDGTSFAGSQPTSAVAVSVNGGLFTEVLGDTSQVNMAAISTATFLQPNLQLRIWFSDGVNPFAALSPAQNLTPAPYAAYADTAGTLSGPLPQGSFFGTFGGAVTLNNPGNRFNGGFTGSGSGLTNMSFSSLNTEGVFVWGNFTVNSSLAVGFYPNSVTAADVNGDGKLDLICANSATNSVSIFTNNGFGGFKFASSLPGGAYSVSVIAADVNGDGKTDLIRTDSDNHTLSIFTNNGNGGYALSSSPVVGYAPYSVVAADVNGDGKVDLICANYNEETLSVLTNNGSGTFAVASTPTVGQTPDSVVAADVNGDGKVDLISANFYAGTLSVLTNSGTGSYVLSSSPTVGSRPMSVVAVDVNGDSKVDLVCANFFPGTLSVLTNNGTGSFVLSSTLTVGSGAKSVVAADVNGDGRVDLISANQIDSTLSVLTNDGSGGFVLAASPGVGGGPQSTTAADLNGDGKVDLVAASAYDETLSVLLNIPSFIGSVASTPFSATNLTSGTLSDARLSTNVALRNASQTFSGQNNFNNVNNSFTGTFTGNGGGLTGLSATNLSGSVPAASLTSVPAANLFGSVPIGVLGSIPAANLIGTVADTRLSANVGLRNGDQTFFGQNTFNNANNSFSGNFNGNGSLLTFLNASQLLSGYMPDARLSANVPLLGATQTFTGANYFSGLVGIGNSNPQEALHVSGNIRWGKSLLTADQGGAIELGDSSQYGSAPHLDFHYGTGNSSDDYNVRLANSGNGQLDIYQSGSFSPMGTFNSSGLTVNGTFVSSSDRNLKENFQPVDGREVLEKVAYLPITRWNYKQDQPAPHVGPMAQDFHAAFNLGADDKHIAVVDESGVALAAIQGLNQKLEETRSESKLKSADIEKLKEKAAKVDMLEKQNVLLAARLNELEAAVKALTDKK